jgi:hypothetical protein
MIYDDSNGWLYKVGDTFSTLIEEFSSPERGSCPIGPIQSLFNPQTAARRGCGPQRQGGVAMLKQCQP